MSRNTAWGNKAYREVRRNGGSKEEAKEASRKASEEYYKQLREKQFGNCGDYNDNVWDWDHPINDGSWHTAEDL